ncbi:ATP-dependent nuclease subunit B [Streptococcus mitis]|uniref:ATP-dependent nuclease subunit B n=1 Tax=Streptococcus mitis TaxID=28037 RepID=UPI001244FA02|nr:ATP-dependent nuclease subunit B [Streptococcus mitis]
MKLLYTDIRTSLTKVLTKEAESLVATGRKVFYISPNSLSFEKEQEVLECLSEQSSFDITVTRFSQLSRYLILNNSSQNLTIDDIGLGMIFYKCLSEIDSNQLKVYGGIKQDKQFIQQLINLYIDLSAANMTYLDLKKIADTDKYNDLILIFEKVTAYIKESNLEHNSPLSILISSIINKQVVCNFSKIALIVDGYTRFSAEEEYLIDLLHNNGVEIIIGCYASQKSFKSVFLDGNLYQASAEFLLRLANKYQSPVQNYSSKHEIVDTFGKTSRFLESSYDFSMMYDKNIEDVDKENLQIWSCLTQKEEIELVARSIRQKLHSNSQLTYKNFRILLGDVASYDLSLKTIFDQYQIPFYISKKESMSHHPMTQFIESILLLKRYNYRQSDLINLLKTGLYTDLLGYDIDLFEQYIKYIGISGLDKIEKSFTKNYKNKFNLKKLNKIRLKIITNLSVFLSIDQQKSKDILEEWNSFLKNISFPQQFQNLTNTLEIKDQEKQIEVWKSFCHVLEQFSIVFSDSIVSLEDFLDLVYSAMSLSYYRTVPATVDTVLVQSYELITPQASDHVYAIGLTQDHFPKIAQNTSLLSDVERSTLNQATGDNSNIFIASNENLKKNRYTMLSLINSARKQLILSYPNQLNESESKGSTYLRELENFGFKIENKSIDNKTITIDDIGSYHSVLSSLVAYYQRDDFEDFDQDLTFIKVLSRVVSKKLKEKDLENPALITQKLSKETLDALYPKDKPLKLSTSALKDFYCNEYTYYLKRVLNLQEELLLRSNASTHGNFLHRIFEKTLEQASEKIDFDTRLEQAIKEVINEPEYIDLYKETSESELIQKFLIGICRDLAPLFTNNLSIETINVEEKFEKITNTCTQLNDRYQVLINGRIDRVDRIKNTELLGVVDYKTGKDNVFKYDKFFNGLNSQLPTYLSALKKLTGQNLFGAMYLSLTLPIIKLKAGIDLSKAATQTQNQLQYQGLFLEKQFSQLGDFYKENKAYHLTEEELQILIDYNDYLYKKAAEKILQGEFSINPYTKDGKSIDSIVQQHQAITGFEANYHLGQARFLKKLDPALGTKLKNEKLKNAWFNQMREELKK